MLYTDPRLAAGDDGLVLRVSLHSTPDTAGQDVQKSAEVTLVGKTRLARGLAVSPSGAWLVAVAGDPAWPVISEWRLAFLVCWRHCWRRRSIGSMWASSAKAEVSKGDGMGETLHRVV